VIPSYSPRKCKLGSLGEVLGKNMKTNFRVRDSARLDCVPMFRYTHSLESGFEVRKRGNEFFVRGKVRRLICET
jgi:hypothetical protein